MPFEVRDSSILADCVAHLGQKVLTKKSQQVESELALALSVYMFSTKSYGLYRSNAHGQPFVFMAIMYPNNKKATEFMVRPAIAGSNMLFAPSEVTELAEGVMQMDMGNQIILNT